MHPATSRRTPLFAAAAVALGAITLATFAGDLDPPAGTIAPTMKTQVEIEPRTIINATNTPGDAISLFKISSPGSYYLTGNVTGVANKVGINIAADNVSIDLMGFELRGVPNSNEGILCTVVGTQSLSIRNGSVTAWGSDGVTVRFAEKARLDDLRSIDNAAGGFEVGFGCVATNCTASGNLHGFLNDGAGVFTNCSALASVQDGFKTGTRCIFENCVASNNGDAGFAVGFGTIVNNCVASDNSGHGIAVEGQSSVSRCASTLNGGDGIRGAFWCHIRDNASQENSGAGIHVTNNGGRVEGNHCAKNFAGIKIAGADNYIVRNTCYDSLIVNYDIAINNHYGEIVDLTTPDTASVFGDSSASVIGTTDPWANFANGIP